MLGRIVRRFVKPHYVDRHGPVPTSIGRPYAESIYETAYQPGTGTTAPCLRQAPTTLPLPRIQPGDLVSVAPRDFDAGPRTRRRRLVYAPAPGDDALTAPDFSTLADFLV